MQFLIFAICHTYSIIIIWDGIYVDGIYVDGIYVDGIYCKLLIIVCDGNIYCTYLNSHSDGIYLAMVYYFIWPVLILYVSVRAVQEMCDSLQHFRDEQGQSDWVTDYFVL